MQRSSHLSIRAFLIPRLTILFISQNKCYQRSLVHCNFLGASLQYRTLRGRLLEALSNQLPLSPTSSRSLYGDRKSQRQLVMRSKGNFSPDGTTLYATCATKYYSDTFDLKLHALSGHSFPAPGRETLLLPFGGKTPSLTFGREGRRSGPFAGIGQRLT